MTADDWIALACMTGFAAGMFCGWVLWRKPRTERE